MTEQLKVGQRVIVNGEHDGQDFDNDCGVIVANPEWMRSTTYTVRFDHWREDMHDGSIGGDEGHHWHFDTLGRVDFTITPEARFTYLNGLMVAPPGLSENRKLVLDGAGWFTVRSPSDNPKLETKMQERFLTAFKDGPDYHLTGDNFFNTQRQADNHANELASKEADVTVVVLKVVSAHSSRIVVSTVAA